MKQCPVCKHTYNDTMVFCLEDGTVLNEMVSQSSSEPAPTQYIPAAQLTNQEVQTVVSRFKMPEQNNLSTNNNNQETAPVFSGYAATESPSNSKNLLIFGIAGLLAIFILGGIGLAIVFKNRIFGGSYEPAFLTNTNSGNKTNANTENLPKKNPGIWDSANNNNKSSPTSVDPSDQLIGSWKTTPNDNDFQVTVVVNFKSDATFSQTQKDNSGNSGNYGGTWRLANNTLYEKFSNGQSFSSPLKYLDSDTFEIITVDKQYPANNGKKLLYHRIKP